MVIYSDISIRNQNIKRNRVVSKDYYRFVFVFLEVFGSVHEKASDERMSNVDRVVKRADELDSITQANLAQLLTNIGGEF